MIEKRHQDRNPTPAKDTDQAQLRSAPQMSSWQGVCWQRQQSPHGYGFLCQSAHAEQPQGGHGHGQPQPCGPLGIGHAGALPLPPPAFSDLEALFDVVVATHKTIDLVVHTRVKKLQRTMQK